MVVFGEARLAESVLLVHLQNENAKLRRTTPLSKGVRHGTKLRPHRFPFSSVGDLPVNLMSVRFAWFQVKDTK